MKIAFVPFIYQLLLLLCIQTDFHSYFPFSHFILFFWAFTHSFILWLSTSNRRRGCAFQHTPITYYRRKTKSFLLWSKIRAFHQYRFDGRVIQTIKQKLYTLRVCYGNTKFCLVYLVFCCCCCCSSLLSVFILKINN